MIHPLIAVVDEDLADATTEPILETMSPVTGRSSPASWRPSSGVGLAARTIMPNAWSARFCPMC
jgi:hypothetical protein